MSQQSNKFLESLKSGDKRTALKLIIQEALDSGLMAVEGDRFVFKKTSGKGRKCQFQLNKS